MSIVRNVGEYSNSVSKKSALNISVMFKQKTEKSELSAKTSPVFNFFSTSKE